MQYTAENISKVLNTERLIILPQGEIKVRSGIDRALNGRYCGAIEPWKLLNVPHGRLRPSQGAPA